MSQGFFNALFFGPREELVSRKVIKFVSYLGLITTGLALMVVFMPYAPTQDLLGEKMLNKWAILITASISVICFIFLYKEKLWAPCILIGLKCLDIILTYMDSSEFPGILTSFTLLFYFSAAKAVHIVNQSKAAQVNSEDEAKITP
ncbi:hypothetical protein [Shewanella sp. SR44-3]|uniref:hypothetical protein n=2 Tax=unclassified Shewanella TaxID=196818 RepID=UPI0015F79882|nr:hypothetical protein [Shewanella sp. SR44-3]MBB1270838.1 hypothetical protein [Shewanella sp. SR44-3]